MQINQDDDREKRIIILINFGSQRKDTMAKTPQAYSGYYIVIY